MIYLIEKIRQHGMAGFMGLILRYGRRKIAIWQCRNAPKYTNPTTEELETIEKDLISMGITIKDYAPSAKDFHTFQAVNKFPDDYHGGKKSIVWDEKLLEHWISSELLGLTSFSSEDIYIDVAAASSPWVKILNEQHNLSSYAIDLCEDENTYLHLPYYRIENATNTTFLDTSVRGMSLHCAYEMFLDNDDYLFIHEVARILKPGGKVIILPLYMHTHYCTYATPEYYGKGHSDSSAKEYVRTDCTGIQSSRKYDATTLKHRVLDLIEKLGMRYQLLALRNKTELGNNIYCHFILEITR